MFIEYDTAYSLLLTHIGKVVNSFHGVSPNPRLFDEPPHTLYLFYFKPQTKHFFCSFLLAPCIPLRKHIFFSRSSILVISNIGSK
jgi:hypothetical protein